MTKRRSKESKDGWHGHAAVRVAMMAATFSIICGCASPSARLHALFDESWEAYLEASPVFATNVGDHRYDDRLADLSYSAQLEERDRAAGYLSVLKGIRPEWLSDEDRLNRALFEIHLQNRLVGFETRRGLTPINQLEGLQMDLPLILVAHPFKTVEDYDNYIARLIAFPAQVGQAIEAMEQGMVEEQVPPRLTVEPTLEQMRAQMVEKAEESVLHDPVDGIPDEWDQATKERLTREIGQAITLQVVPAYRKLLAFVEGTYLPACRETVGIWDVPKGDEFYARLIEKHTTLPLTAEEVHQTGLNELKRIHAEMEQIKQEVGFAGTLVEFMKHLRDDPQYRAPSGDWLMKEYAAILERATANLPKLFGNLPQAKCYVKEIEPYRAPSAPVAYYNPSAPDGSRPGYFYVNTYKPEERVTYTTEALAYHEAVPGHHLQIALHSENSTWPKFRRYDYLTAYAEGWALYTEGLGEALDGYKDPLQRMGRLTYDSWRASRLVVDTGIHHLKWSRADAIRFMEENTALARYNIEREVDRYIAWPGQALGYKIGEIVIRELRAEEEAELGERFDIRDFHDRILGDGPLPMTILQERMRASRPAAIATRGR